MNEKQFHFLTVILFSSLIIISSISAKAATGFLGVRVQNLSNPMKTALSIDHGVLVINVIDKSPAQKAGIKAGDLILEIQKIKIINLHDLLYYVARNSGKEISLKLKKGNIEKIIKIKLGESGCIRNREWQHYYHGGKGRMMMPFDFHHFDFDENQKIRQELEEIKRKLKKLYKDLGKDYIEKKKQNKKPILDDNNFFQRDSDI